MQEIRENNLNETAWFTPVLRGEEVQLHSAPEYSTSSIYTYKKLLDDYDTDKLEALRGTISRAIESWRYDADIIHKLRMLRIAALLKMKD